MNIDSSIDSRMLVSLLITWIERRLQLIRAISGVVAWLLALAIVGLSLIPDTCARTALDMCIEHIVIFLAAGMAFGFAYPHRLPILPFVEGKHIGIVDITRLVESL
jgi:hypothetical protein